MKAIILVGGEGTRLRPLTYIIPKAMMPVLNIPFMHHVLRHLHKYNTNEVVLSMGYKPDTIRTYFNKTRLKNMKLHYNIESKPLGTAGAVKFAHKFISHGESFLVLNGDIFSDIDLDTMFQFHRNHNALVTIALTAVDEPSQFGVVELDKGQRIRRFVEKPKRDESPSNLINAGIYIMEDEVLDQIPEGQYIMFEHDVFPQLLATGKPVFGYITDSYWIDMGNPQKYKQLNMDLLCGKCKLIINHPEYKYIGKGSKIHSQTKLTGPLIIDTCCNIEQGTIINGPAIIGANCQLKNSSSIDNSIIWHNVHIGKNTSIKNSIITCNCIIKDNSNIENEIICQGY